MSLSSSLETIPDSQEYEKIIPPQKCAATFSITAYMKVLYCMCMYCK